MKDEKISFEKAVEELEGIVQKLEKGELPLDEAIDVFQRGIELSKFCSKRLDDIEKRITSLVENEKGEIKEEEFKVV